MADVVRLAASDGIRLRVIGGGGWLDAGSPVVADRGVALGHDTGVVAYVPGDLTVTVRAGTTLGEIDAVLSEHGQWLALDPAGAPAATIGAVVATDSSGPAAALYGTARDQVLGMTVVTGAGEIVRPGGRVVKNVAGFDVTRLMIGAWGTLGVVTEITLRVRARGGRPGAVEHLRRPAAARFGHRHPTVVPGTERVVSAVKRSFDPQHILNPGILGELVTGTAVVAAEEVDVDAVLDPVPNPPGGMGGSGAPAVRPPERGR